MRDTSRTTAPHRPAAEKPGIKWQRNRESNPPLQVGQDRTTKQNTKVPSITWGCPPQIYRRHCFVARYRVGCNASLWRLEAPSVASPHKHDSLRRAVEALHCVCLGGGTFIGGWRDFRPLEAFSDLFGRLRDLHPIVRVNFRLGQRWSGPALWQSSVVVQVPRSGPFQPAVPTIYSNTPMHHS